MQVQHIQAVPNRATDTDSSTVSNHTNDVVAGTPDSTLFDRTGVVGSKVIPIRKEKTPKNGGEPAVPTREQRQARAAAELDAAKVLPLTEYGNARRVIARHAKSMRYIEPVQGKGEWYTWDGKLRRWVVGNGPASRMILNTLLAIPKEAADLSADAASAIRKWSVSSQREHMLRATIGLTALQPEILGKRDEFDRGEFLLGVENGVIDLTAGTFRRGRKADRITRSNGITYDKYATCPRWRQFMLEVMGGDEEMVTYLQRAVGYSLTGSCKEEVLFLLIGTGANGKGVFADVLRRLGGLQQGYAYAAEFTTFLVNKREIRNDLAALAGMRVITASEPQTGEGKNEAAQVNVSLVKEFTSITDPITCRFLGKENFSYVPQGKLWFLTNNRPDINDASNGIWRRLREIRFGQSFDACRDRNLPQTLEKELPGILNWAIEGAVAWYKDGLQEPEKVKQASAAYRREMDPLEAFIADACEIGPQHSIPAEDLYTEYADWLWEQYRHEVWSETRMDPDQDTKRARLGYRLMSANLFGRKLTTKGHETKRMGSRNATHRLRITTKRHRLSLEQELARRVMEQPATETCPDPQGMFF